MILPTAPAGILAAAAAAPGMSGIAMQILPLVLIFLVFYFLLLRPQQQRLKTHK